MKNINVSLAGLPFICGSLLIFILFGCGGAGSIKGYRYATTKYNLQKAVMTVIKNNPNIYRDSTMNKSVDTSIETRYKDSSVDLAAEVLIFAEAVYRCLEFDEAFNKLTTEIEATNDRELSNCSYTLLYFQDSITLDWIEKVSHRIANVSESWGVLAAASQFTWQRAEKWLSTGRPLSLICLV